ncbi:MAG: hypothetical protein GF384_05115 [Elusimicrobia bacterium]|nr:hypothetical protein [Elusimicrobiota bacterium]MBD3412171.1 hypothetical protein [Elusimicrobiota bacterium]
MESKMIRMLYVLLHIIVLSFFTFPFSFVCAAKDNSSLVESALRTFRNASTQGSIEAKVIAARAWAQTGSEEAKDYLIDLLDERNHDVFAQAALSLNKLGSPIGKKRLDAVLEEPLAINESATPIMRFKEYSQYKFRKIAAAEALGTIGDMVSLKLLKNLRRETPDGQIRDACSISLAMLGDPAERMIFENAASQKTTDAEIRETAVKALGTITNDASTEVLIIALSDPVAAVRAEAARALGIIGDPKAASYLREAVRDDDLRVRREMVRALGTVTDPENVPVLTDALDADDGILRLIAARALGRYGYAKGLSTVKRALSDKDRDVRLQAVRALETIEHKDVSEFLKEALEDSDDVVRVVAAEIIIKKNNKKQ